jgi:hypothetical protein
MKAIHSGKAKTDKIDAQKIAVLLRGGMLPQAYVYPKGMRESRDLLRRRTFLVRRRAEALVHLSNTNSQYNQQPSLRHYVRAAELKATGLDWTEVLAIEPDNPRARLASELLASPAHGGNNARARAFVAQGGGCRATFFNYRRRLTGSVTTDGS